MKYSVSIGESSIELDVERRDDGSYLVHDAAGSPLTARTIGEPHGGSFSLLVNGHAVDVNPADAEVRFRQERYSARALSFRDRAAAQTVAGDSAQARKILASMPGRIVRVLCQVGSVVTQGSPLIVIEAMKMQNELCAKADATVCAVHVSPGQTVERGALLVEFE